MLRELCVVLAVAFAVQPFSSFADEAKNEAWNEAARDVQLNLSDVYIPSGFDSGSDAYVVVSGLYPNSCYSWKDAEISHLNAREHEIRPIAQLSAGPCMMVVRPFAQEVQLGRFEPGVHLLRFVNGDGSYFEKQMNVN